MGDRSEHLWRLAGELPVKEAFSEVSGQPHFRH